MALSASLMLVLTTAFATNPSIGFNTDNSNFYVKEVVKTKADGLSQTYMQYYCVVDLPESSSLTFGEGSFNIDTHVLTFTFSYNGDNPAPGTPVSTYDLPVFELLVPEGEEPIEIENAITTGNDSSETSNTTVISNNPVIR